MQDFLTQVCVFKLHLHHYHSFFSTAAITRGFFVVWLSLHNYQRNIPGNDFPFISPGLRSVSGSDKSQKHAVKKHSDSSSGFGKDWVSLWFA